MTGNPLPWLIITGVVLGSLFYKGIIRLPTAKPPGTPFDPRTIANSQAPTRVEPIDVDGLAKLGSYVLGLALAKAVRSEAESTLAVEFARNATAAMHATFTAPFSAPAPAGPTPPPAGP